MESAGGWTEERVELLKKLWLEGLSASQIAGVLGEGGGQALGETGAEEIADNEDRARFGTLGDGGDRWRLRAVALCAGILFPLSPFGLVPSGPWLGDVSWRILDAIGGLETEQAVQQAWAFLLLGLDNGWRDKGRGRGEGGQCKEEHRISG